MKILINTPDISKSGGVANFFGEFKRRFTGEIYYNFVGGRSKKLFLLLCQLSDYLKFVYLLITIKPDLVHLNPSLNKKAVIRDAGYLMISYILGFKTLVYWHGWDQNFEKTIDERYKNIFNFIFSKADGFCVLAVAFKTKLERWIKNNSKPIFLETAKVDDSLIENFKIKHRKNNSTILFLSRLEENKGIYICLKTFMILKEKYKDLKLIIAGDGTEKNRISEFIVKNEMRDVSVVGYVVDKVKAEILNSATLFILPTSHGEGMPASLLEAMMFGLPVITRPVGGIQDFFIDGKMGFMTDSLDPHIFAGLIEQLIQNQALLEEIFTFNRSYAKNNFLASKVAARIEEIYRKILEQ